MNVIKQFEPLFGEWYAESLIGAGSFGRVYKAYREEFGEKYYSAIKYISIPADDYEVTSLRDDGMDDESITTYYTALAKDVAAETRLMSKLKGYSNIVSYEDSRVVPKANGFGYDVFIRMELLESLSERTRKASFSQDDAVSLGMDICTALEVCAEYGIIHRDIKPDNIFINAHGDHKLGDFGIARQLEKTATFMSKKGTYNYMAPEVYKGEKYGASCDIYSLGLVMYRLLNKNRLPFFPQAPLPITPADKEKALMDRLSGKAMAAPCGADAGLVAIVLKACAYDPKDRFASAEEMKSVLDDYIRGKRSSAVTAAACSDQTAAGSETEQEMPTCTAINDAAPEPADYIDATQSVFTDPAENDTAIGIDDPDATQGIFGNAAHGAENCKDETVSAIKSAVERAESKQQLAAGEPETAADALESSDPAPQSELPIAEDKPKKKKIGLLIAAVVMLFLLIPLVSVLTSIGKNNYDFSTVSVGDTIVFGSYEQDNDNRNGKEDIEWIVLAKRNDRMLVVSKYALDCKQYNSSSENVNWETCSLRKWLNSTFLKAAFDLGERNLIQRSAVTSDSDTTDKVFLLSLTEANSYFGSDGERQCKGTAYCSAQGANRGTNSNCKWWLRSPGSESNCAAFVYSDGTISGYGFSFNFNALAVRPAMWIRLG